MHEHDQNQNQKMAYTIDELVEIIARQTAAEELYGVPANDNEAPDATAEGSK